MGTEGAVGGEGGGEGGGTDGGDEGGGESEEVEEVREAHRKLRAVNANIVSGLGEGIIVATKEQRVTSAM